MTVSLRESIHGALMYAVYFAPRGKRRLLNLGNHLAQRHLSPQDKLIGVIGDDGAGKSLLTRGIFPGLELSNDDTGVNTRPLPLLRYGEGDFFSSHTYHLDMKFELAFTQMHILVDAVNKAIDGDKRVVIEHFDLIYPYLGTNAEILIGIGEEVIVTRPNIFGPQPKDIADIVFPSLQYRKMCHSTEDITQMALAKDFGFNRSYAHGDVKHGFLMVFSEKPRIDISALEAKVKEYIDSGLDICFYDDNHIKIGDNGISPCTGPRIHVRNTLDIKNFQFIKEYRYDPISKAYALVGLVGDERPVDLNDLNCLQEW
jgi:hypothetical protein